MLNCLMLNDYRQNAARRQLDGWTGYIRLRLLILARLTHLLASAQDYARAGRIGSCHMDRVLNLGQNALASK